MGKEQVLIACSSFFLSRFVLVYFDASLGFFFSFAFLALSLVLIIGSTAYVVLIQGLINLPQLIKLRGREMKGELSGLSEKDK